MLENVKIKLTSNLDDLKKKFNDSKMQIIFEKKKIPKKKWRTN
jgi:hypothetical protein